MHDFARVQRVCLVDTGLRDVNQAITQLGVEGLTDADQLHEIVGCRVLGRVGEVHELPPSGFVVGAKCARRRRDSRSGSP